MNLVHSLHQRVALRLSMADKRVRGLIDVRMFETLNKEWKSVIFSTAEDGIYFQAFEYMT